MSAPLQQRRLFCCPLAFDPPVLQALKDADACGFADGERSWLLSRLARQVISTPSGAPTFGGGGGDGFGSVLGGGGAAASQQDDQQQSALQWERGVSTVAQDFETIDLALQSCEQAATGDVTPAWWGGRGAGQRSKALAEARLALALDSLREHFSSTEKQLDKCSGLSDDDEQRGLHATSAALALRVALDAARSHLLAVACLPASGNGSATDAQVIQATLERFGVLSTQECAAQVKKVRCQWRSPGRRLYRRCSVCLSLFIRKDAARTLAMVALTSESHHASLPPCRRLRWELVLGQGSSRQAAAAAAAAPAPPQPPSPLRSPAPSARCSLPLSP